MNKTNIKRIRLTLRFLIIFGSSCLLTILLQALQYRDLKGGILWFFKYQSIHGLITAAIIFIYYLGLLAITNRFWITNGLIYLIFLIFGFANSQKSVLRSEPLLPSDLTMAKNATSLTGMISKSSLILFISILIIGVLISLALQHYFRLQKGLAWYGPLSIK